MRGGIRADDGYFRAVGLLLPRYEVLISSSGDLSITWETGIPALLRFDIDEGLKQYLGKAIASSVNHYVLMLRSTIDYFLQGEMGKGNLKFDYPTRQWRYFL